MRINCRKLGRLAVLLGLAVLLAVLLPTGAWPLVLGLYLIAAGICLIRR